MHIEPAAMVPTFAISFLCGFGSSAFPLDVLAGGSTLRARSVAPGRRLMTARRTRG
jgi:hypothetical protein